MKNTLCSSSRVCDGSAPRRTVCGKHAVAALLCAQLLAGCPEGETRRREPLDASASTADASSVADSGPHDGGSDARAGVSCEAASASLWHEVKAAWTDPNECTADADCVLHEWEISCSAQLSLYTFCAVALHRDSAESYDAVVYDVAQLTCSESPPRCEGAADCLPASAVCAAGRCELNEEDF